MDNNTSDDERKEAEALMKRLESQFGDIDLDLEILGLENETKVAEELNELESSDNICQPQPASSQNDADFDADAAALMARLGAQFGDLDMSQLGLGTFGVSSNNNNNTGNSSSSNTPNVGEAIEPESDEESSLEEPTPEELAAWQASQFDRGKEIQRKRDIATETRRGLVSVTDRRKLLRENSTTIGASDTSISDLLGNDTSIFFGPSSTQVLEELVSNEVDGDPEILQTSWRRLYASYEDGLGFWNLWNALRGYDGPSILVLRCLPSASKSLESSSYKDTDSTACLGFYTTTTWRESTEFYGGDTESKDGDRAFLFSIDEKNGDIDGHDRVRFFPVEDKPTGSIPRGGYMYCQPSTRTDGNATSAHGSVAATGLGVGGRPTQPRFHLTESFEDCSCMTYDTSRVTRDGDLFACFQRNQREQIHGGESNTAIDEGHAFARALYSFDVTELEAWGVGGNDWIDHALKERERDREQHILRFQKVDKQMMWDQGTFANRRRN